MGKEISGNFPFELRVKVLRISKIIGISNYAYFILESLLFQSNRTPDRPNSIGNFKSFWDALDFISALIPYLFISRTRHAACPVLIGNKWVSNKWTHEFGNEFVRRCDLDKNSDNDSLF